MAGPKDRDDSVKGTVARTLQVDDGEGLRERALAHSAERRRRPILIVLAGPDVGERTRLSTSAFVVGRAPGVDLLLNDLRVSSRHFRVEDRGDGFAIVDLGSTNGTSVNGERLDGERALENGDRIVAGDTVFRFELQDALDSAYADAVQRLIDIDDLTGLYQRRRFDRELATMLASAAEEGRALGLLVMDLDGVKAINDTNGHLFGAHVISESGKLIGRVIADPDYPGAIAARFGGDEYVVACPDADLERATQLARAIHRAIGDHRFEKEGRTLEVGISVGVAAFPDHAGALEDLFKCADGALYSAKRAGKNRVAVHGA
ncbi:MAG: GGDEF domain-containing protein [Sandaracinaceae bacterium]